jgi:hypothetical protein
VTIHDKEDESPLLLGVVVWISLKDYLVVSPAAGKFENL